MMLEKKIDLKSCANKVKALRMSYVPLELERCRNGCENDERCPNYVPLSHTHDRFKDLNLYRWKE